MAKGKPHICFVAPTAYSVLSGSKDIKIVGGAELQQTILSKALVKLGYKVSMICMDHGQEEGVNIDGVEVFKAYKPDAGMPVLRFIHPRLTSVLWAMKKANADIYFQSTAGMLTGVVAAYCKFSHKKSIYYAASDADFSDAPTHIKYRRDMWLYQYGLKHVDRILTQNGNQRYLCKQKYGRDSILVPNIYDPPENVSNNSEGYVLWVSTIRQLKRPELFLEIAKLFPSYRFVMVGGVGIGDELLFEDMKKQADSLANLDFVGFVPYAQIDKYFDGARVVINTSDYEGFPNAFLQAWARKIPTVSFFDCGARLNGETVGYVVPSLHDMASVVDKLMSDNGEWQVQGERCWTYFEANHSVWRAVDIYNNIFELMVR